MFNLAQGRNVRQVITLRLSERCQRGKGWDLPASPVHSDWGSSSWNDAGHIQDGPSPLN